MKKERERDVTDTKLKEMKEMKEISKLKEVKGVRKLVDLSIIIICDKIRQDKLERLGVSLKPQLEQYAEKHRVEVLLLHESEVPLNPPQLPLEIKYFNIPAKRGIPFNRNQGIYQAQGKVVVFIDDDCWVPEKWLASLLEPLSEEKIMAVTGGTVIPPADFFANCISALGFPGGGSLGFDKVWKVSDAGMTNHLSVGNCALRREVFEKVGFFDEFLKHGAEDTEFSYRLEKAGLLVKYVPAAFAYHEPRSGWKSFIGWQIRRGRANYQLQKKVPSVKPFLSLRWWSAVNLFKHHRPKIALPFITFLMSLGYAFQMIGYIAESWKNNGARPKQ